MRELVPTFKYLELVMNKSGKFNEKINASIATSEKMFFPINKNFLSMREVAKETKLVVYCSTFVPIINYGSESWVLKRPQLPPNHENEVI